MRYLFFAFVLNVCACAATGTAHAPVDADNDERLKALSIFGVTGTGTGYVDGDSIMSIQCAPSGGDAAQGAKAALRLAHDEIVKMRCGAARADYFAPDDLVLSLSGRVSCVKITVKVADIKCKPGQ